MDEKTYARILLKVLREHSAEAQEKLRKAISALPDRANAMEVGVHTAQDGDGIFSIVIHLLGPDLYVLNKAIRDYGLLFDVRYQDGALIPEVPLFDPSVTEFEVNDVIVDTSLIWLKELFSDYVGFPEALPVTVFGADGYGTRTPAKIV